jgi:O-antigen/teichoic acid export membrane protein
LPSHEAGIYGGLNKIGTIMFYLTLSVSQVLFPRVVDAVARRQHPGRLLLSSAAILSTLGVGALLIFAVAPDLVVSLLYGPAFRDATPYVIAVGLIGVVLSLNNMLVQFLLAVRDYWFVPFLAAGCIGEAALIALFHAGIGQVVADVVVSLLGLLLLLVARCWVLLPSLGDRRVADHAESLASSR